VGGGAGGARGGRGGGRAHGGGVEAGFEVAGMQAWRKRAGIEEPPHRLAAAGPYGRELAGEFQAAATAWMELGRPYEAALALADAGTEDALRRSHGLLGGLGARATAAVIARPPR